MIGERRGHHARRRGPCAMKARCACRRGADGYPRFCRRDIRASSRAGDPHVPRGAVLLTMAGDVPEVVHEVPIIADEVIVEGFVPAERGLCFLLDFIRIIINFEARGMNMNTVRKIYDEISQLPAAEKKALLIRLVNDLRSDETEKAHSIFEIKGVGTDIWKGIDAQEYVSSERDSI